jgi:hypothetical protein
MNAFEEHLVPYLISQVVSLIFLIVAWNRTRWARWLFAFLFFWAGTTNLYFGITKPDIYLEYADMAIPFYRDFINGWFSRNIHIVVPMIAIGQFFIAISMLLKGFWVKLACLGSIIFLLSIAPLLVGAAFPFSITVSIAAFVIYLYDDRDYAWTKQSSPAF